MQHYSAVEIVNFIPLLELISAQLWSALTVCLRKEINYLRAFTDS